jgi:NitT/TauT family transport system ATP-binding protein
MNPLHPEKRQGGPVGVAPLPQAAEAAGRARVKPRSEPQDKLRMFGVSLAFGLASRDSSERRLALREVSLEVESGEVLVLVGPSGCGKSSLLGLMGGLLEPTSGQLLLDGKAITRSASEQGILFQLPLLPWRTALENVESALEAQRLPVREQRDIARGHLEAVGLSGFGDRFPYELSEASKRRLALARSLAQAPRVLLMDEPFAGLGGPTREALQDELLRIQDNARLTIVLVTHDLDEAVYLGHRVAVMTSSPGRIKHVVEVAVELRQQGADRRASAAFGELRQRLRASLNDEVLKATEQPERTRARGTARAGARAFAAG